MIGGQVVSEIVKFDINLEDKKTCVLHLRHVRASISKKCRVCLTT